MIKISILLVLVITVPIILLTEMSRNSDRLDCMIAQISPDVPHKLKEECREKIAKINRKTS